MPELSAQRAVYERSREVGGRVGEDFIGQVTFQLNLKGQIQSSLNWGLGAERVIQTEQRWEMTPDPVSLTSGVRGGSRGTSLREKMGKSGRLSSSRLSLMVIFLPLVLLSDLVLGNCPAGLVPTN